MRSKDLDLGADINTRLSCQIYHRHIHTDLAALFGNDNPVHLEIGCGKGGFVTEAARRNPDVNFLAVEKTANVIVCGCEKVMEAGLSNVRFLKLGAEYLWRYLPTQSIGRL